jgi:hypothetical protein
MRPEWIALADNINAAAEWLRNPDQPRGAMVSHLGFSEHCGGMLTISVSATGWHGARGKNLCTFVFDNDRRDPDEPKPEPFTAAEMDEIAAMIEATGVTIVDRWNGAGLRTGSFGCRTDVAAAVKRIHRRYLDGCPKPGHTVFCGQRATWTMERTDDGTWIRRRWDDDDPIIPATDRELEMINCTWDRGFDKAKPPAWTAVPWPTPPESPSDTQTDDDRNLDAVRRALTKLGPLLVEMGYHHSTIVAGRRGDIVEDDTGLRFTPSHGHGVCIPAEAAEALVALAAIGHEMEGV